MVFRCYVENRPDYDVLAKIIQNELSETLRTPLTLRIFNRYDIQHIPADKWQDVVSTVLSEPMSDICYQELPPMPEARLLCIEPLPGQFDARSDSCEQCIQMLLGGKRPVVRTAVVYAITGADEKIFGEIKKYLLNPLESREASLAKPESIGASSAEPTVDAPVPQRFNDFSAQELQVLGNELGFAMSLDDMLMLQAYFRTEGRAPTLTELRAIDTYWSDHCRHTTFNTIIETAEIDCERVKKAYELFLSVNGERSVTFMNMATAAMRHFHKRGELPLLDLSEENNACTLRINAEFEDKNDEEWLLFFKNETHNHPTEIEPYGGASTCIGGAIRDPLSGRSYVYQGMRITGCGDPRKPLEATLAGKLPQRKITVTAAEGFSSYGNQIGVATGYVKEFYHEGYIAKRLETGAVVGAAPACSVRRGTPSAGDIVVLLGGRTGRDGVGGATGSSKTHGTKTVDECASEVQKGNAPEERKLQRLFRNPDAARLIIRCNDFGAGGVSVAIGEIAEGVEIYLDKVPTKYDGLNGTELAISESQERMAVVVASEDLAALLAFAEAENIEATEVARVTADNRLVMLWRGNKIFDIDRKFLDTNGAKRTADVYVPSRRESAKLYTASDLPSLAADLNFCSQKGLVQRFDSTIGAGGVLMPFGGKYELTETQVMAALLPANGTKTASVMACGFEPHFTDVDPFSGAAYAVVVSAAKLIGAGVPLDTIYLSFQEYFPRLHNDKARWGKVFSAMLGAFTAQMGLKAAAIGGKDSMSGTFGELDVPSTLISFAVGLCRAESIISPEFKRAKSPVYRIKTPLTPDGLPDYDKLRAVWGKYSALCQDGKILSAWACESGGLYGGIMKMALGNMLGFKAVGGLEDFSWGSLIFEAAEELSELELLGYTQDEPVLAFGEVEYRLAELCEVWENTLEGVFPVKAEGALPLSSDCSVDVLRETQNINLVGMSPRSLDSNGVGTPSRSLDSNAMGASSPSLDNNAKGTPPRSLNILQAQPKAIIPVFPGTNCEYDTAAAIERAGGICQEILIRNLTPQMLQDSVTALAAAINTAQMLVFPGGFSGGDEPAGAGKFIVSLFRGRELAEAVQGLLQERDGLILGICNGFQALIKLGLLTTAEAPATLTFNRIGRHQSRYVTTRVTSVNSPWLSKCEVGEVYTQPISHGEGRFAASSDTLDVLARNGQIAFQYVDHAGSPSMDITHNPNGSAWAIEGITSPDGRILGKMAHTERYNKFTAKNIYGEKFMPLFEGGINYYR
ncbi:MAG: phosphoribosylformylglycinamidine synthase [Defluviitaleaceae bacterium]|nr:phosphoribosylformylglycinamidine synthase [Defluviitaleaceae bacterium]